MSPKELTNISPDLPEEVAWGFVLNCWDCFSIHQDLRSVIPAVVLRASDWLCSVEGYLNQEEKDWCSWVAEQDSTTAYSCPEAVKKWSFCYAAVTLVMRKLLVKSWTDPIRFNTNIENHRKSFERYILEKYGQQTDWHLPNVSTGKRGSIMERTLKKLNRKDYV